MIGFQEFVDLNAQVTSHTLRTSHTSLALHTWRTLPTLRTLPVDPLVDLYAQNLVRDDKQRRAECKMKVETVLQRLHGGKCTRRRGVQTLDAQS